MPELNATQPSTTQLPESAHYPEQTSHTTLEEHNNQNRRESTGATESIDLDEDTTMSFDGLPESTRLGANEESAFQTGNNVVSNYFEAKLR